ncbi:MAG: RlmE family RNA methyltransferase [Thermodesulfobacteriota bacterium]|nr:RlmE family RNA methyltransferase [Thermodesulfobacteriota bacterium]
MKKKYRDHYSIKAGQENYPARSVYKLKEMDKRFRLFSPGNKVLDLGAAPGSWTLYAAQRVRDRGRVLAVDRMESKIPFPANVTFFCEDVFSRTPDLEAEMAALMPFDVVLSDMAPNTTGNKITDQARSLDLAGEALALARTTLVKGGRFVVKIFMGPDVQAFVQSMRPLFEKVKTFKPKSSRSESKEMFYLGLGFRGLVD